MTQEHYYINLDLKPALDEEKLDRRLLRDFEENANRDFHNVLEGLVPRLMVPVLVERTGIPAAEKVHSVTKAQRRRLLEVLKCLRIDIQGPRPVEEAIVTSGGMKVSEIGPTTLESQEGPRRLFCRGGAGCGCLHWRLQPANCLVHRPRRWRGRRTRQ